MQLKIKVNLSNYAKYVGYVSTKPDDVSNIDNIVNVVSCFTDETKSKLYKFDIMDLAKAESQIMNELNIIQRIEEPKGYVEIDGKRFEFDKTIKTLCVAQMIDLKIASKEFYEKAAYIMSILYINKEVDRVEAAKLFVDDFPINEYEACCRFFFQKYKNWREITLTQTMLIERLQQLTPPTGTYTPTRFTLWLKILKEMSTTLLAWLIALFYIGKNFSSRSQKRNAKHFI